jgi:hypothetical protein
MGEWLHALLILVLLGDKSYFSLFRCYIQGETAPGKDHIRGWKNPNAGLERVLNISVLTDVKHILHKTLCLGKLLIQAQQNRVVVSLHIFLLHIIIIIIINIIIIIIMSYVFQPFMGRHWRRI